MVSLWSRDFAAIQECVRSLHDVSDHADFPMRAIAAFTGLIPAALIVYDNLRLHPPRLEGRYHPPGVAGTSATQDADFVRLMHEHPLIRHCVQTADTIPCKISDFLTRPQLHDLALYQEFFRIVGTEHQMVTAVRAMRTHVIGLSFNRECSDFTERERLMLAVTRAALIEGARAARAMTKAGPPQPTMEMALASLNAAVVRLDADLRIRFASPLARSWLAAYFTGGRERADQLPGLLARWVRCQSGEMSRRDAVPVGPMSMRIEGKTGVLTVRMLLESGRALLVLEERRTTVQPDRLYRLGLTPREAEVLSWVAQGKSNSDTATILGTRPRTIHKHLDRIFTKLGVENRTAAARLALATLYE